MAADGTTMLAHYGEGSRAYVRAPVAIGANAWRDVSRAGAVSYALRAGGVVDVVLGDGDLLTLIEDTPTGKREVLIRVPIGDLWCLGHKNGRIVGIRRKPAGSFERIVIEQTGVTVDGAVLDGSGATEIRRARALSEPTARSARSRGRRSGCSRSGARTSPSIS